MAKIMSIPLTWLWAIARTCGAPAVMACGLFVFAASAHAGTWSVELSGSNSGAVGNYTFVNNVVTNPILHGPPTYLAFATGTGSAAVQNLSSLMAPGTGVYNLNVQAQFVWNPSGPTDTPPATIAVLESGSTLMDVVDSGTNTLLMQACDGFPLVYNSAVVSPGDPDVFNSFLGNGPVENRWMQVESSGNHVSIVPASTTFTLPLRQLALGISPGTTGPSGPTGGELYYGASVDTAQDVQISIAPAIVHVGGTVNTTVTITPVNGFHGTVSLTPIWAPVGLLPTVLPSGQKVVGGWTTVGFEAGGNNANPTVGGPTRAQLAAGVTGVLSPSTVTIPSGSTGVTATLQLTAAAWAVPDVYAIQIRGSATSQSPVVTVSRDGVGPLTVVSP